MQGDEIGRLSRLYGDTITGSDSEPLKGVGHASRGVIEVVVGPVVASLSAQEEP